MTMTMKMKRAMELKSHSILDSLGVEWNTLTQAQASLQERSWTCSKEWVTVLATLEQLGKATLIYLASGMEETFRLSEHLVHAVEEAGEEVEEVMLE